MEPSNTSPPRTPPPPSHITNSFSPGSKSMFPDLNIRNNEKARLKAGPPQQKKRKVNKNNTNKTNNNLQPNRVLTEEKQEERIKCLDILSDIQYLQNSNYECCVDICNTSTIKNIEIVTTYLNELKKHNVKLCNIDVEKTRLEYTLGKPPQLNLNGPFEQNKRIYNNNKIKTNSERIPPLNLPVGNSKNNKLELSEPSTKKKKLTVGNSKNNKLTKKASTPVPAHAQSSQNLSTNNNILDFLSSKFKSPNSQGSPEIESTQEYLGNNSQTPPK
jgi:hypothetical protein